MEHLNFKALNADNLYFTADLHLGHGGSDGRHGILKLGNRPFDHVDDMHEAIIENWNSVVPDEGVVFVLGDVVWKTGRDTERILSALKGRKVLIRGNHEMTKDKEVMKHFELVRNHDAMTRVLDYKRIDVSDPDATADRQGNHRQTICMMHYPILSFEKIRVGSWMLHGHCHGSLKANLGRVMDIGVDTEYYGHKRFTPYTYAEVKSTMEKLALIPSILVDHHVESE